VGGEPDAGVEDHEPAVETLAEFHAAPRIRAAPGAARDLDPAPPEAHGVVAGHHALVPAAQELGEVAWGLAPRGGGLGGRVGEAAIEVREELRQEGVGGLARGDPAQAQFADEAILQGSPEALDAALGLGRAGREVADPELLEHAPEVGGILDAPQLLVQAPVRVVAHEDVEAIAVEGQGQAVLGAELVQQGGIAVQVLGRAEVQGEDGRGGVVDGSQERHRGASAFEPVKRAAVELHEGTPLGLGGAAGAVLARPAPVLGRQPQGAPDLPHRLPTEPEPLHLVELLGGVTVVEPLVGDLEQGGRPLPHGRWQAARGGAAAAAMDEAAGALGVETPLEALELAHAEVQCRRALGVGNAPCEGRLDQAGPGDFLSAHREGLPCLHGMTFSRSS